MTESHTQAHDHGHDHHHHHDGEDTYFMDQLCLIGFSGAFGVVCLTLSFNLVWRGMLDLMLAPQFHLYVLLSGIMLVVFVAIRSIALWQETSLAGPTAAHDHSHDHDHHHGHTHDHHNHDDDHDHHHGQTDDHHNHDHDHHHGHSHSHGHGHSHSHGHDHDHSWAPWRYVVLFVPIIFYLLGLPARLPSVTVDEPPQASIGADRALTILASGFNPSPQLATMTGAVILSDPFRTNGRTKSDSESVEFKQLQKASYTPQLREGYQDKLVKVVGQYYPSKSSNVFTLVRIRVQCCSQDSQTLQAVMVSREPIEDISRQDWVEVVGRLEFRKKRQSDLSYTSYIFIPEASWVKPLEKPPVIYEY